MKANFEQSREQLKAEFQNLANQILEEKGKTFAQNSQSSLDALLKPFREQIDGFQQRVNQVHDETLRGNVSLGSEIKRVLDVGRSEEHTSELQSLMRISYAVFCLKKKQQTRCIPTEIDRHISRS